VLQNQVVKNYTKSGGFLVYVLQYQVVALLGAFLLLCSTSRWFSTIVLHFQVVIFGRHRKCNIFSTNHLKLQKPVSCLCGLLCHHAPSVKCNDRQLRQIMMGNEVFITILPIMTSNYYLSISKPSSYTFITANSCNRRQLRQIMMGNEVFITILPIFTTNYYL